MPFFIRVIVDVLFCLCLFWCMACDIKTRRIPNGTVLFMLGIALFSFFSQMDWLAAAAAGMTLLLLIPWRRRALGAGDIKLLFCSALYLGLPGFCVSLAGMGIAALIYMLARQMRATDRVALGAFYAPAAAAVIILKGVM